MQFNPPVSESEFRRRAEAVTVPAAEAMIKALRGQKNTLVKPIDDEIAFYEKVIKHKTGELS